ncbi:hypothetical protein IU409_06295 [Nocardia cyriacigeorgica]|uniref:hypothetical protein n=1 Tax=Nocardia cyriacigeorgica TaxID=135487 RepID=UPI001894A0AB|nr:hypothetical protein [Nocardia cyriacigeorgica]MBF6343121.1 hypothetical protein [Nocardia cyriacigeorgica]
MSRAGSPRIRSQYPGSVGPAGQDDVVTDGRGSLVDLLIAGLTAPNAVADEPLRQRILRELEDRLPAEGDGPPTVTRALGPIESYRDTVRALGRAPSGRFEYEDAICALIAVGAVPADEADDLAPFLPAWSGFRRQLVLNSIAAGDLDGTRSLAAGLDDEHRWRAYRDIGAELAARGDAPGFFAEWRNYAIARDRDDLAELAKLLVVAGREEGAPGAGADVVEGLQRVLHRDAAGLVPELDQLILLSAVIRSVSEPEPQHNHPLLDDVVDRLVAIGASSGPAVAARRDALLAYLWPAIGDHATRDRVRDAIRTPGLLASPT